MPVVAQFDPLVAEGYQPFDVKLIGWNAKVLAVLSRDAFGLENDDLPSFRRPEIVSQPIHKQMIAIAYLHAHHFVALVVMRAHSESRPLLQLRAAVIRRKPNPVRFTANFNGLNDIENQQLDRL